MKAKFEAMGNDLFWELYHFDYKNHEWFKYKWYGYNDANWWGNVAPKQKIKDVVGDKGTTKTFEIDFNTCEVKMY